MHRSTSLAFALGAALTVVACTELRGAATEAEAPAAAPSDEGTSLAPGGATPSDAGAGDAAVRPPADDVQCRAIWSAGSNDPACTSRHVQLIDPAALLVPSEVALARTSTGRIGIVYGDGQEMRLASFTPTTPAYATPQLVKRTVAGFIQAGATTRIAAGPQDTFHVLVQDLGPADGVGDFRVVRHIAGSPAFGAATLALSAVRQTGDAAIAVDDSGATYVTARVATANGKARVAVSRQIGTAAFTALPNVAADLPLHLDSAPQSALVVDPGGALHIVYHHDADTMYSFPRYHAFGGTEWTYRKTLDNQVPEGFAGYGAKLVVSGGHKVAAFFFVRTNVLGAKTAEVRVASWDDDDVPPEVETIAKNLPTETAIRYRLALGVDGAGLVHVAVVHPNGDGGYLEYDRQKLVAGKKTWVAETIDSDVLGPIENESADASVDMFVEPGGRPHIAYRSGKDGRVRYATRFDR